MREVTIDASTLIHRYVAAWNEADPERRRAAVGRVYADNGCIITRHHEVNSAEAIPEHVGEAFTQLGGSSGYRFRCAASTSHDWGILMRWVLAASGHVAGSGVNVLVLGPDGPFEAHYQFGEPQPVPETSAAD